MTTTIVTLSDGTEAEVRRLGIFELDVLDPDPVGPFTYKGKTLAGEVEIEYDGSRWEKPPPKPEIEVSELVEGTPEWYEYREWELYHAWEHHERRRMAAAATYHEKVAQYILDNCLQNGTKEKVVTPEDWANVHTSAMVPQMTQEDVAEALRNTFPSYF